MCQHVLSACVTSVKVSVNVNRLDFCTFSNPVEGDMVLKTLSVSNKPVFIALLTYTCPSTHSHVTVVVFGSITVNANKYFLLKCFNLQQYRQPLHGGARVTLMTVLRSGYLGAQSHPVHTDTGLRPFASVLKFMSCKA